MSPGPGKIGAPPARRAGSKHERPPNRAQTAAYIALMCGELAAMAKKADLALTQHLLAMAKAEAESIAEKDR